MTKADETSQLIAESNLTIEEKLSLHLEGNHYPPINKTFIPVAQSAIEYAKHGEWDNVLEYPNGLRRTVEFTIENMHLEWFLEN